MNPFRSDIVWYVITAVVFISLVSLAGYGLIRQQKRFLVSEKLKEISTIVDLKTSQLVDWRKDRFAEGASIRANAMMTHRVEKFISGSEKEKVRDEFRLWLANLVDLGEYSNGVLATPDGKIIASNSEQNGLLSTHYRRLIAEATTGHEIILSDFHTDGAAYPYDIDLVIPIMNYIAEPPRCVAVLVLDIDPSKRLYPLISSWPTKDSTAETLLVRREGDSVLFLSELRYQNRTEVPFKTLLTNLDMPAVKAALGQEGTFEGVDYRNVAVLSAIRTIPGTTWGLVAKIDVREVLTPLSKSIFIIVGGGIGIVVTMILGVVLWGVRRRAQSLRNLLEIQRKSESELHAIHEQLEQQILERTSDLTEINSFLRLEMLEREQLENQLLSAKRLEAIGQIAGGVAHEVRNPLNAILTVTEALFREQEIAQNRDFDPYIEHIRTQVNRLAHLMNDLLDLGRTIPVANLLPIKLYDVCRETLSLWMSTGMSKNKLGSLVSDNENLSILVVADTLKLQQVFFNLLENAGQHTPVGSRIILRLVQAEPDRADSMALIQVIDQGVGIPEERLTHVFDPFYTDRKGGTGLGLALVKHFIENMGGTVQIWNNNPPPGCTVEVRIPLYRGGTI
jgi:signal transduction histidine kinase